MQRAQQELRKHFNKKSVPCRMRGRAKQNRRSCTELKVYVCIAHPTCMGNVYAGLAYLQMFMAQYVCTLVRPLHMQGNIQHADHPHITDTMRG